MERRLVLKVVDAHPLLKRIEGPKMKFSDVLNPNFVPMPKAPPSVEPLKKPSTPNSVPSINCALTDTA